MTDYKKLPILIYDSECTMCNRFRQGVQRLDIHNQINCISLHDEKLYEHFPEITMEQCKETIHLLAPNEILTGSQVIEYLIGIIPGVKKLSWLLETGQGKKTIEFFYRKVNELRNKSSSCSNCKK